MNFLVDTNVARFNLNSIFVISPIGSDSIVGRVLVLVNVFVLLLKMPGYSQNGPDSLAVAPYKNTILPSPTVSYAPETDVVVGIWVMYQFKEGWP